MATATPYGQTQRRTILYIDEQCASAQLPRSHQDVSYIAYTETKLMTAGDTAIGRDLQVVVTERSTGPRGHGLLQPSPRRRGRCQVAGRPCRSPVPAILMADSISSDCIALHSRDPRTVNAHRDAIIIEHPHASLDFADLLRLLCNDIIMCTKAVTLWTTPSRRCTEYHELSRFI